MFASYIKAGMAKTALYDFFQKLGSVAPVSLLDVSDFDVNKL